MKKNVFLAVTIAAGMLASCSGGQKKVNIVASGSLTVNDKSIKIDPGFTHNEKEVTFSGDKVTLTVESTNGTSKTFDLTENGSYLLNLQTDTLIGGIVNYGDGGMPGSITSELLDHIIDSTQKLMAGQECQR